MLLLDYITLRRSIVVYLLCFSICTVNGQIPQNRCRSSHENHSPQNFSEILADKEVPSVIEHQVAAALSYYPELKNVPIIFRFARQTPPLTSRPKILHVFKKSGKRTYVVTISNKTKQSIIPILFNNLETKAQIGVLGHELAHIAHYETMNSLELLALPFNLLSAKYVDRFELETDQSCIDHGLGEYLMDWSSLVREKLEVDQWMGYRNTFDKKKGRRHSKRYMDPEMIRQGMVLCKELYGVP